METILFFNNNDPSTSDTLPRQKDSFMFYENLALFMRCNNSNLVDRDTGWAIKEMRKKMREGKCSHKSAGIFS